MRIALGLLVACSAPAAKAPSRSPEVPPTQRSAADLARDKAREPLAASVLDAYPNSGGSYTDLVARWSPDGAQIVFGSLRDGLPELYLADAAQPASPAVALTKGPERALSAHYTPDGKAVLFLRDTDGDEYFAIWRVDRDGTNLHNLTPTRVHRSPPFLPRKAPNVMLYATEIRESPGWSLVQQDVAGDEPKPVYTTKTVGGPLDVAPDGTRALIAEFHGAEDDVIVRELEVATGAVRRVYPPEGQKAGYQSVVYSSDGTRVLVSTYEGARSVLFALDAASGKELARYHDAVATAELSPVVSPIGDVIALGVDAGNHGEVRILDANRLTLLRSVQVPLGEIHVGTFRADGRAFSLLISLPDQPPDIFRVDTREGTVAPLRDDPRPGLAALPPLDASIQTARAFDGLAIPLNIYLPRHAATRKLPVIVSFHGGPSASSAVRWSFFTRFFSALGYAVVEPNVRGSTGFGLAYEMADNLEKRFDWLKDLATVNTWVRAQPWADPERIVAFGGSYGGYTVLMALTRQPIAWRAGVDMVGIADLRQMLLTTVAGARIGLATEYGDVDKDAQLLAELSPMHDVDRIVRPLFVYAGQNDPGVPRSESDTIVRALRERHLPVEYMVAANEGHGYNHRETKLDLMTRIARFLENALR